MARFFPCLRAILEVDGRRYLLVVEDVELEADVSFNDMKFHIRITRDGIEVLAVAGRLRMIAEGLKMGRDREAREAMMLFARLLACIVGVPVSMRISRFLPPMRVYPEGCGCREEGR